jgi:hypothetical protein
MTKYKQIIVHLLLLLASIKEARSFEILESISSALVYKPNERLRVYASDLYEDPLNPRLSHSAKFSEYFQDDFSLNNTEPTLLQKLFKENYYNTSFSVGLE